MVEITEHYVREMFAPMRIGDSKTFFDKYVEDDVDWVVGGPVKTCPFSGHYTSKQQFLTETFGILTYSTPLCLEVLCVTLMGTRAAVELRSHAKTKNGHDYDQRYAWICQINEAGRITHMRAYLDTALVKKVFDEDM